MQQHRRALALGSAFFLSALACVPAGEETGAPPPTTGSGGSGGSSSSTPSVPAGTGGAGAGGATGTAPTPPPLDSGTAPGTGGTPAPSGGAPDAGTTPDDGATPPAAQGNYTCTLLFGINATAEWYGAGFESMVDNARWELVRVHSGFVDLWANPASDLWNTGPTSPCATNAKTPDRIIFVGLRFEWTDKAQWVQALTAVVKNLKAKYPSAKHVELATFVRGPGNKPCGSRPPYRSTIHPSQDEAIAEVVATDPGYLSASPKFEVTACSDFSGNPPHFSGAGTKNVAKIVGDHYAAR